MATSIQERRQLERQARRRKIQRVARRVFTERGFEGATIEDIARKCSLSVGAIYLYFKSKEEIFLSLLCDSFDLFTDEVQRILASPGDVRAQLGAVWDLFARWSESFRFFLLSSQPKSATGVSGEVLAALGQAAARSFALVQTIIDRGIAEGIYRPEAKNAADLLCSAFTGLVALQEVRTRLQLAQPDFATLCRSAFETLERGMLA